jgi:TPR repeat protein
MVNLGMIYIHGIPDVVTPNYKLAHKYLTEATEMENSNAMVHLSYMYKLGLGMKKDP